MDTLRFQVRPAITVVKEPEKPARQEPEMEAMPKMEPEAPPRRPAERGTK
jgi:hypothetical protein